MFRNEWVWLLNLVLKVVSQLPILFMILLLLAFFFRDPVELVALAAACESCCVATMLAGCFMEMSVALEGGGSSCGVTVAV